MAVLIPAHQSSTADIAGRKCLELVRGKKDRRGKAERRILWMAEESYLYEEAVEDRRLDVDVQKTINQLLAATTNRKIGGIVFATIRRDGKIDLGMAGLAYDSPLLASGLIVRLQSMLDRWVSETLSEVGDGAS